MKHVLKQASPQKFEDWKSENSYTHWEAPGFLKEHLLTEQGYICCYCGMRIFKDHYTIIEHLEPRAKYPHKMYEYTNLLASCNGDQKNITYVCKVKDTWATIQQKYQVTTASLYAMNFSEKGCNKLNPYIDQLQVGHQVIIQLASNPRKLHCDAKKGNEEIAIHPKIGNCESYFFYDYDGKIQPTDSSNKDVVNTIETLQKLRRQIIQENLLALDDYNIRELERLKQGFNTKDEQGMFTPFCQVVISILENEIKYRKAL